MTPYFEQDGVTLYHGDCREVRRGQRNFKHSLRFRAKQVGDNTFQIRRTR
ncbi:MAG: hypothetical protein ACK528_09730 [Alphaproteobacteria bacterium]|jgi:hypothetical protein